MESLVKYEVIDENNVLSKPVKDDFLFIKGKTLRLHSRSGMRKEFLVQLGAILKVSFPELENDFIQVLFKTMELLGFSESRALDSVLSVVTRINRLPKIADFTKDYDFEIKVFTYEDLSNYLWEKYKADWVMYQNQFAKIDDDTYVKLEDYHKIKEYVSDFNVQQKEV